MRIEFYKETTDDFYPSYKLSPTPGSLVCNVTYGNLSNGKFYICVSGSDDYMLVKVSNTSLNNDLYTILETPCITKEFLKSLGFTE